MKWDKIKNFVLGGGLVLVWAVTLGFLDWRAQVYAREEVAKLDIGTDQKIIDMDSDRLTNTHDIETNTENIVINRDDVRRAFLVLMGEDRG